MLVYIIKSGESEINYENRYATLDKDGAKKHIIDEILSRAYNQKYNDLVEEYAQDLVDGNTKGYWGDEFEGMYIWCDILELEGKIK